jgi:hypothetical protein
MVLAHVEASVPPFEAGDLLSREEFCRRWDEGVLDWWKLDKEAYLAIEPDSAGILASDGFPDLRLDRAALLAGDVRAVLAAIDA